MCAKEREREREREERKRKRGERERGRERERERKGELLQSSVLCVSGGTLYNTVGLASFPGSPGA